MSTYRGRLLGLCPPTREDGLVGGDRHADNVGAARLHAMGGELEVRVEEVGSGQRGGVAAEAALGHKVHTGFLLLPTVIVTAGCTRTLTDNM